MAEKTYIPLCIPCLNGNERKYVDDCLDTGWISSVGKYVTDFETAFASYTGSKKAVAVASGTAALHLALLIAGVKAGDEVFVQPLTFIAPVNAISYLGASPLFIDVDRTSLGISPEALEKFIAENCSFESGRLINRKTSRHISALVTVHIYGHCCDIDPLQALARKYNLKLIEDAAESIGTHYKGRHVGNDGIFGCFSFNGNKTLTTGGGGMIVCNDEKLAARAKHLSTQAKKDETAYSHDEIGYNYRMSNIQAALGLAQLEQIENMIEKKRSIHKKYLSAFTSINYAELFNESEYCRSNYWMGLLLMKPELKQQFAEYMAKRQIQTRPFWVLNNEHPMYSECSKGSLSESIRLYEEGICIPCGAHMNENDTARVIESVVNFKS